MPRPPKARKQPDVARALSALRRMVRGFRIVAETVDRDFGITAAQLFVLSELARVPDQSVKDLAATTMTTHSTVSQVVGQLISKGLVVRTTDANDGRRAVLRLSRQGTCVLKKAPRALQQDMIDGFATLQPTERHALANGLERWMAAAGFSGVPANMLFERSFLTEGKSRLKKRKASRSRP